jgi:hypothetical protein
MIPSGYKEDVVYSQIPTDGSGDLSFTRASNGTRINSSGLVEVCPWNLLEQSNAFSTSPWSLTRATLTSGQSGYDGLTNAWKYTEGTFTANLPVLEQSFTSSSDVETYSFYLKAGTRNWVAISVQGTGYIWINLTDGTVGSAGGGTPPTATTQLVGNGWYLVSVSSTGTKFGINLHITDANNSTSYNGNGTGFVYVQNAQRNIGTTAKPYFPTTDRLNVPRLTYQNGGGGCPSLLLEKQSTNLALYSEQFDNASWIKLNGSVTANIAVSPDGTQNADSFIPNTTSGVHALRSNLFNQSATASHSWFVKANGYTKIAVRESELVGNYATFNLTTGTLISTNQTGSIENLGNGWYRCTLVDTTTGVNAQTSILVLPDSYTSGDPIVVTWSGDGTKGVFAWGAQVEISSYPTSYIPTTSASATRVADSCFKTGISSLIGQTEGVAFWDIEVETLSATGNENIFNLDAGSFGDTLYFIKGANGVLSAEIYVSGVVQCSFSSSLPSLGRYKMALAYKANDFAFYINGVLIGTDSSGSVPAMSRFQLGNGVIGPSDGKTNQAILFPTRLSNSDLISLTTL